MGNKQSFSGPGGRGKSVSHAASVSMDEAVARAGTNIGHLSVSGRYHRFPKKLEDDYKMEDTTLGTGYNGSVLLARSKGNATNKYAVKSFNLNGLTTDKREALEREAEIFLVMDHPHVARLMDVYEVQSKMHLVMECMEGGELFDRVTERKMFSEQDAANTAYQMLLAVNYIHSMSIVHRDLKLENFLYEKKDTDHLKLIDFGFSKVWDKNTKMELSCGTLSYVAPEVLSKSYTSQCDMWSLGVIVFILLSGYMPFHGSSEREQIKAIREGKFVEKRSRWEKVSARAFDFVKKLLVVDPKVRLNAEEALADVWIAQRQSQRTETLDRDIVDSLQAFAQESQFRRSCMQLMAWSLTSEERAEVRQAFLELDKSGTGTIKLEDLRNVLCEKFELSEEDAKEVFKALDAASDNVIHYSEFLAAMVSTRLALHDHLLRATFNRFDTDNSGTITKENLREVLGEGYTEEEMAALLKEVDLNGDGAISYDEFIHFLKKDAEDIHVDAAHKILDREVVTFMSGSVDQASSAASGATGSPGRIRKRDRLKAFGRKVYTSLTHSGDIKP